MSAVKDRIKQLVDQLPEAAAVELERALCEFRERHEFGDWTKLASQGVALWEDDGEVEYTETDAADARE